MNTVYSVGLDIGTSSVKGVLIDINTEQIIKKSRSEFLYETDESGRFEIIPENYLKSCIEVLKDLTLGLQKDNLKSICFSSASGNLLFLDDNFEPLSNIINWQDTRTNDETKIVLGENFNYDSYFKSTGWYFDKKTFPLASLCRIKCSDAELISKSSYIGMSTEYLCLYLTGNWGISTSAGTPLYLIDQLSGSYNEDVLRIFDIDKSQLPPVMKVGDIIGCISEQISEITGIPSGVPVVCGTFDHPSAARGADITKPGELLISCGTSWVGFFPVASRDIAVRNRMLIDPFLSDSGGCWSGMVSIASISASIEKYVRKYVFDGDNLFDVFDKYASESKPGAKGLKLSLDDSEDDSYVLSFDKPAISRAIMECVVGKIKSCIDNLDLYGYPVNKLVMVGGPSESKVWPLVISDMLNIEVKSGFGSYTGAFGAARIAAGICK